MRAVPPRYYAEAGASAAGHDSAHGSPSAAVASLLAARTAPAWIGSMASSRVMVAAASIHESELNIL